MIKLLNLSSSHLSLVLNWVSLKTGPLYSNSYSILNFCINTLTGRLLIFEKLSIHLFMTRLQVSLVAYGPSKPTCISLTGYIVQLLVVTVQIGY